MSTTTIAIIAVAILVIFAIAKLVSKGGKVTDYFKNAVRVYLWLEDSAAGYAALAAAKTAATVQRDVMISHLVQQTSQFGQLASEIPEFKVFQERLANLAQQIAAKDWTVKDTQKAKDELGEISPKYLNALNRSDPNVFVSRYPALFQASSIMGLIEAAEQIKRSELERGAEVMEQLKELKEFQDPKVKIILDQGIEQAKRDLNR